MTHENQPSASIRWIIDGKPRVLAPGEVLMFDLVRRQVRIERNANA